MRRTIPDWLTHAGRAAEPTEVEQCLDQAMSQAASCNDWRTLLNGVAELPLTSHERLAHIANRTLEFARGERDVWGFRDVATVRATRLDDAAGARAALEACVTVFGETRSLRGRSPEGLGPTLSARGYEWVLLGQGFVATLRDDEGMRRCLKAGRDAARAQSNAHDLCSVATEWAKRVDRNGGVALLLEAEAMAGNGSARPWTVANAWHSLDDSAAVHRVLDTALQNASSVEAALHVTSAWASHRELDEVRHALARA